MAQWRTIIHWNGHKNPLLLLQCLQLPICNCCFGRNSFSEFVRCMEINNMQRPLSLCVCLSLFLSLCFSAVAASNGNGDHSRKRPKQLKFEQEKTTTTKKKTIKINNKNNRNETKQWEIVTFLYFLFVARNWGKNLYFCCYYYSVGRFPRLGFFLETEKRV